jgi:hypothetical protein
MTEATRGARGGGGAPPPPPPPLAHRHVEPSRAPFQILLMYTNKMVEKIHKTYFGMFGQQFWLSPNFKAQQRKKSYPTNNSCLSSPVASTSLPPHAVSRRPNPKSPVLSLSSRAPNPNLLFNSHGLLPSPPLRLAGPALRSPRRNSMPRRVPTGGKTARRRPRRCNTQGRATSAEHHGVRRPRAHEHNYIILF